jgi:hypothetical protein
MYLGNTTDSQLQWALTYCHDLWQLENSVNSKPEPQVQTATTGIRATRPILSPLDFIVCVWWWLSASLKQLNVWVKITISCLSGPCAAIAGPQSVECLGVWWWLSASLKQLNLCVCLCVWWPQGSPATSLVRNPYVPAATPATKTEDGGASPGSEASSNSVVLEARCCPCCGCLPWKVSVRRMRQKRAEAKEARRQKVQKSDTLTVPTSNVAGPAVKLKSTGSSREAVQFCSGALALELLVVGCCLASYLNAGLKCWLTTSDGCWLFSLKKLI